MDNKTYDDFEPFCKWVTENNYDLLKVYLQGFKEEHVKIEIIDNKIIIHGECPFDEIVPNRMKRFQKEVRVSSREYNIKEINTKFEAQVLSIIIPKHVASNLSLLGIKRLWRTENAFVQVALAVSLGMVLGAFLACKCSQYFSKSSEN